MKNRLWVIRRYDNTLKMWRVFDYAISRADARAKVARFKTMWPLLYRIG